jgi:MscS family membrane protein
MLEGVGKYIEAVVSMIGDDQYLQAAVAVCLGVVLAWLVTRILGLFQRWARRSKTHLDDLFLSTLRQPLSVSVMISGLLAAAMLLPMPETAEFVTLAALRTILVFVWIRFAIRVARFVCRTLADQPGSARLIQPATLPLFDNVVLLAMIGAGAYIVLQIWNVDITAWVASAGIIGLALSFAAKDSLANLFAGVFIIADAPYRIGDYVVLDTGERGRVTHIGIRSTRLLTRDDVEVTIPNAVMGNSKIVNESGGPQVNYRVRLPVTVCYGEDLDKVRDTLMEVVQDVDGVTRAPFPRVRFRRFGNWGIDVELLFWVHTPELRGQVTDTMLVAVYKKFNETGIVFPYPRQELYLRQMKD